jgi:TonB family protein
MSNRSRSIILSVLIHATLLVLLLIFGFSTPLPLPSEEGILINFGTSNDGSGNVEPISTPIPAQKQQEVQPEETEESPITQDVEEAPSIPEPKPNEKPKPKPEKPKETTPQETVQQQEQPKVEEEKPREVIQKALFPGKKPEGGTTGEGETGQAGNQGNPDGSPDSPSHTGNTTGGAGDGVNFSLSGRSALSLPLPEYPKQKSGRVIVRVTVDRNGNVLTAEGGQQGSTTLDNDLIKAAEKAAKLAKFDVSQNAPASQTGTITYIFKLQQ